jgi:hypothetical protein
MPDFATLNNLVAVDSEFSFQNVSKKFLFFILSSFFTTFWREGREKKKKKKKKKNKNKSKCLKVIVKLCESHNSTHVNGLEK